MNSNLSIVTFLSIGQNPYKIFFLFQKPVEDVIGNDDMFWYEKRGQRGDSKWIWEEKEIKQWTFSAKDTVANKWIEDLKTNKFSDVKFKDIAIKFELLFDKFNDQEKNFDYENVPNLGNEIPSLTIAKETPQILSILLDEPDNIDFIEGYKSNKNISPILPDKFFEEGFLKAQIKSHILFYRLNRLIRFEFKGDRHSVDADKNTTRLFGMCFESKDFRRRYEVVVLKIDKTPNGTCLIDEATGKWEVNLTTPASKGFILLREISTGNFDYATRFYLLKEFNVNVVNSESIIDSFNNSHLVASSTATFSIITPYSWEEEYFADRNESLKKLSLTLESMLCSLGKNIVLNDPYMFGITKLDNNIPQYNESQLILLNALSLAIVKAGIETITIIGRWDDAKKSFNNGKNIDSKESLYNIYEVAFKAIKKQLGKMATYRLRSISIVFPQETFHDRFWAEVTDTGSVINIYHISSSVSAYSENGELIIMPLEGSLLNKIRNKIEMRLKSTKPHEIAI